MASFYKSVVNKAYINIFYALNIALDSYLSEHLLEGDSSRIVYSSTEYALVKRSGQQQWNNANLPFINYRMDDKTLGGSRNWFSFEAYSQGVYVDALRRKLRLIPVSISYDASYWTGRDDDYQFATDMMLSDAAAETKLEYYLDYNGTIVKNIAILNFNFDTSPQFSERDWLEKNNIWSFSINPSVQTFMPVDNVTGFCIPKKILFDFCVKKDLIIDGQAIEAIEQETLMEFVVDHINQTITPK